MKLIIKFLLPTALIFGLNFHAVSIKNDCYPNRDLISLFDKCESSLSIGKNTELNLTHPRSRDTLRAPSSGVWPAHDPNDRYFLFTFAIALIAIGIEIIVSKSARITKRRNQVLSLRNKIILKQNQNLQNALSALEERIAERHRVLQIIAHDLRSPIAAIVGLSGFLIDEDKLREEDMEVIRLIHTSGVDSLKFISEILEQERTTAVELKNVDLYQLLGYCIAQLKFKADEKQQRLVLTGVRCNLNINREKIWRAITNLLTNAIKFSPSKGKIAVDLQLLAKKVVISIKDNGIGIPEHLKDKIFGLNSQRKRIGTSGEKSFGMGLTIAKQNIEAHGGTLYFKSEDGHGTTFFIELPILTKS